jgi:alkane 1-monooxygenase
MVLAGNLTGGWWSLSNTVYSMVLLIVFERFTKPDKTPNVIQSSIVPDTILALHVLLHTAAVLSLIYGIHSGILTDAFIWMASVSTGISSGIEGINSAHELIHRRKWMAKAAGIWNLLLVNYSHFFVEHVKGHHRYVGTPRDPATARFNESFYHYFLRTVPAQYKSAVAIESNRLRKINRKGYGAHNLVLQLTLLQIIIGITIFVFTGLIPLLAWLHQSLIAFFLLEYVNYIEHYGLIRKEGMKVNAVHSWQSDMPISRFALIELSRHSDHHVTASKPYYHLVSHAESPVLPSGYFGSFYLALFPAMWFKKVNPVLNEFLEKEITVT